MKTPFFKRAVALILVALMILGTLGYLFSVIAYADEGEVEEGRSESSTDNATPDSVQTQEETPPATTPRETPTNLVESSMDYTILEIKNSSKDSVYTHGSNNKLKAPTIKPGQLVTFLIRISDPTAEPKDIKEKKLYINAIVGGGSFVPTKESKYTVDNPVKEPNGSGNGIVYEIKLSDLQYTGESNILNITIRNKPDYIGVDDHDYYVAHQVTVTECEEIEEKEETPSVSEPDDPDPAPMEMATPYVIISNYDYGGIITAGETFPLTITLYNTSKNVDVENMMVTITMPEAFMLTSSSNTFYIEELHNGESVTKKVDVTAKANADPQSHNIDISMKYQYVDEKINTRKDNTTQETISIPVVQVDRFQLTGVDVPMEIYMGEEGYLSVNFVNKGRSEVYNLSAEISGDIQNPGQQQNLGNLASGATGTADFYITPNGEGVCSGEVTITYEDTNMEEKTATIQWSTNVVDPFGGMDFGGDFGDFDPGMMEDPSLMEGEQKSPLPFIAGGVGVAAVVAGVIIWKRMKRKKREAEDADL